MTIKSCLEMEECDDSVLKVVSKSQIRLKSKAQTDEKAQSARVRWRMSSTF